MYELQFDQEDLFANKQGYLSPKQDASRRTEVANLKKQTRTALYAFGMWFLVLMAFGISVQANSVGWDMALLATPQNQQVLLVVGLVFPTIIIVIMIFAYIWIWRYEHSPILVLENPVRVVTKKLPRFGYEYLLIVPTNYFGSITFRFADADSLAHFQDGRRYRIYYLPYANPKVLSAEML